MPSLTVFPQRDSTMDGVATTTNYGGSFYAHEEAYYPGSKSALKRSILNFDVSALAGRTLSAAKLIRNFSVTPAGTGVNAKISRCTRPSTWTENGVTWAKYDGSNNWTAAGGDFDDTTPTAVTFAEPTGSGEHTVSGLLNFVTDAITNRSGIVSIIIRLTNEGPGTTQTYTWDARELAGEPPAARLVIDHDGAPFGVRRERYFMRGLLRGVMRGVR